MSIGMQRQKMECLNNMLQLEVHEFVLLIEEKKQIKTYKKYIVKTTVG